MLSSSTKVAVLGAGLTGMSAAWHLQQANVPHRIFERRPSAGGHVVTLQDQGFCFDRTGHLLHLRDPAMRELALRWIGQDHMLVERHSMIWSHGGYTHYPYQANTFGLPPQVAYECILGFFKAKLEPSAVEPTNFEEFCLAHFGEGFSRHFMIPYNCRLWGVHPREITAAWCSRFVPLPKLEDVIAGSVGLNDRQLGYNTQFLYPRKGIGALTEGMARDLPHIEFERAPTAIDAASKRLTFDTETVDYHVLVSSAPLDQLCAIVRDAPQQVRQAASLQRCSRLWYLDVALDVPCGKPYHWVYVPEERYPFYRVGCYSHFSPALVPDGKAGLYIELADRNEPDLDKLLPSVTDGLIEMGFIRHGREILFARKRKIDYAYVIFDHNYFESVATVQRFLLDHDIISTGRYGGWNYSSMEDALIFGRDAAHQAAQLAR
jgi:YD repeat-containing protein